MSLFDFGPNTVFPIFDPVAPVPDSFMITNPARACSLFTPPLQRFYRISNKPCRFLWRQTFYCHSGILFTCPLSALRLWYARSCHSEQPTAADTLQAASLRLWGRGPARARRAGGGGSNSPASAYQRYGSIQNVWLFSFSTRLFIRSMYPGFIISYRL